MQGSESESLTNYYRKRLVERIQVLRPLYHRLQSFEKNRLMLTRILVSLQKAQAFPAITQAATIVLCSPPAEWAEKIQDLQTVLEQEKALRNKEGTDLILHSLTALQPVSQEREAYLQDVQKVRNIAHSLAGSGGTYGFKDISQLARLVESAEPDDLVLALQHLLLLLHQHARHEQPTAPQSILLIQKDPDLTYLIQHHLQSAGLQCQAVQTAHEAWQEISKTPYPVIITDLVLPDLDGRRLIFELHQHPDSEQSKIVVLASPQQLNSLENITVSAVLSKPLQPEALVKKVQELLLLSQPDPLPGENDHLGLPQSGALQRYIQSSLQPDSALLLFALPAAPSERLRSFTQLLKAQINPQDFPAHYKQDHFLLFLPSLTRAELQQFLKGLQSTFASVAPELLAPTALSIAWKKLSEAPLEAQIQHLEQNLKPFKHVLDSDQISLSDTQAEPPQPPQAKPVRILLADDDPLVAAILRFRIEQAGLQFEALNDGEQVLPSLSAELPDLLILDVKMPGKDGFTVLKELRQSYSADSLPVMMLTALGNESHVIQGLESGANDYMQKPFSPDELMSRLHLLLRKKAQRSGPTAG
ncbi:MAG: response regulator [Candidatus Sericytochromatia bacterium]